MFFYYTVLEATSPAEYDGYTAAEGNRLIVCSVKVKNTFGEKMCIRDSRSFSFITKTPPAAVLIKKAVGIESGSGVPNKTKVASITKKQLELSLIHISSRPLRVTLLPPYFSAYCMERYQMAPSFS